MLLRVHVTYLVCLLLCKPPSGLSVTIAKGIMLTISLSNFGSEFGKTSTQHQIVKYKEFLILCSEPNTVLG